MNFGQYVAITGAIICCTIAVVSMLWGINNSLKKIIELLKKGEFKSHEDI